ncbi:MAG: HD-GYP domain-containing protein [Coprococcus sp.]
MLSTAAMMHDINKLMISEEILNKPSRLTDEEFAIMKSHVLYGDALLSNVRDRSFRLQERSPRNIMRSGMALDII